MMVMMPLNIMVTNKTLLNITYGQYYAGVNILKLEQLQQHKKQPFLHQKSHIYEEVILHPHQSCIPSPIKIVIIIIVKQIQNSKKNCQSAKINDVFH